MSISKLTEWSFLFGWGSIPLENLLGTKYSNKYISWIPYHLQLKISQIRIKFFCIYNAFNFKRVESVQYQVFLFIITLRWKGSISYSFHNQAFYFSLYHFYFYFPFMFFYHILQIKSVSQYLTHNSLYFTWIRFQIKNWVLLKLP